MNQPTELTLVLGAARACSHSTPTHDPRSATTSPTTPARRHAYSGPEPAHRVRPRWRRRPGARRPSIWRGSMRRIVEPRRDAGHERGRARCRRGEDVPQQCSLILLGKVQRVAKSGTGVPTGTNYFIYDEQGKLIAHPRAARDPTKGWRRCRLFAHSVGMRPTLARSQSSNESSARFRERDSLASRLRRNSSPRIAWN